MCITRHLRLKKDSVPQKFSFKTHHRIDDVVTVVKRWRRSGGVRLTRSASRKKYKKWRVHFRDRGWGRQRYMPPRLGCDMATPTANALDSGFTLLLMSRIWVDTDENCRHHVIIGINHGYASVVDINSRVCCLAAPGDHEGAARWLIPLSYYIYGGYYSHIRTPPLNMLSYPRTTKLLGGILVSLRPTVRLSVRPSRIPCPLCSTYSLVWFHIYTSYQSTSERVSRVTFLANFRIWIFKICYFDFTLFSLGIWCASLVWVITGRWWVSQNVSCQYKELWLTCFLSIKDIDRTILKYLRCQRLSWSKQGGGGGGGGGGDNDTRRYNLVRETHFMYSWLKVMYKHYSPTFASYHAMYTLRKITHINISCQSH